MSLRSQIDSLEPNQFVDWLRENIVALFLAHHDISSKARKQARGSVRDICGRVNSDQFLVQPLLTLVSAGLAGASDEMQSGAIDIAAKLVYLLEGNDESKIDLVKTILMGNYLRNPQLFRSVVRFIRLAIQGIEDPATIAACLEYFSKRLLMSPLARSACRARMRTLMEKMGKRFGWERVNRACPAAHAPLLRYTHRMLNRRLRKHELGLAARKKAEEESSSDEDEEAKVVVHQPKMKPIWLVENSSNPLNLASQGDLGRQIRQSHPSSAINAKLPTGIEMSKDGRLIIQDESMEEKPKRRNLSDLANLRSKLKEAKHVSKAEQNVNHRKPVVKSNRKHEVSGMHQFAPGTSHGAGDAKRKGQTVDPYAYIRLNPNLVKEKFKAQSIQSFKDVMGKSASQSNKSRGFGRGGTASNLFTKQSSAKVMRSRGAIAKKPHSIHRKH